MYVQGRKVHESIVASQEVSHRSVCAAQVLVSEAQERRTTFSNQHDFKVSTASMPRVGLFFDQYQPQIIHIAAVKSMIILGAQK